MAEAIGVVASAISIVGAVKTCIDLYDIVSDARHASKELDQLVAHVHIERVRFFLWCQLVGLADIVALDEAVLLNGGTDLDCLLRNKPHFQHALIIGVILNALQSIEQTFQESKVLLETYTNRRNVSFVSRLLKKSSSPLKEQPLMEYICSRQGPPEAAEGESKKAMSTFGAVQWAFKDKVKFKALVKNLRLYNDGLENILEKAEKIHLRRQRELLATTTPFARDVAQAIPSHQNGSNPHSTPTVLEEQDIVRLVELYDREFQIAEQAGESVTRSYLAPRDLLALQPLSELQVLPSDIDLSSVNIANRDGRIHTLYKSQRVMVEWKYYSVRIKPELLVLLKHRTTMLALQLQQSSQTSGFSTLRCRGQFDDRPNSRIGLIFEHPTSNRPLQAVTLRDRIAKDRRVRVVRDLGSRFILARTLTLTFYRLHSVGWLHKSFRSDNVLFFEDEHQDPHYLSAPYVCGFDFSRQDSPTEMTEAIPTVLLEDYTSCERTLYRHPDLDYRVPERKDDSDVLEAEGTADTGVEMFFKRFRFRKSYDIYSLGIVLLEIGLWCRVSDLCGKDSVADFREKLRTTFLPELRYRMGKTYFDVVCRCIEGRFGDAGDAAESGFEIEDSSPDHLGLMKLESPWRWLEMFNQNAVSQLEKCFV